MEIAVVGSINLDFVASVAELPEPGETVTGATLARHPGGKGANQALAARRLGAEVQMIGRIGRAGLGDEAMRLLRDEGVDLSGVRVDPDAPSGVALIAVDPTGENMIVVAPGANHRVTPADLPQRIECPVILQLELPIATVEAAVGRATGFVCVNLAPAQPVTDLLLRRADLIVVNEVEAKFYGDGLHHGGGKVAVTYGAGGAALFQRGGLIAESPAPQVDAIDAVGAGDAFVGALTVALLEGMPDEEALAFACAAGGVAATRHGAQPSLPTRAEVDAMLATMGWD